MALQSEKKAKIIKSSQVHSGDTGSPEVQIALQTSRIIQLTDHLKIHKHDESTRRGLLILVGRRRRLLKYLQKQNYQGYLDITEKLNIRRK